MSSFSSIITDHDIYLFKQGKHYRLYNKLGAQVLGSEGVFFAVWAPNAHSVSVIGDFNSWDNKRNKLQARNDSSGIWEGIVPAARLGEKYKFHIKGRLNDYECDKGDPFGRSWEMAPRTATIISDMNYTWQDQQWMQNRQQKNSLTAPMSIYEVHLGSWRRDPDKPHLPITFRQVAKEMAEYVHEMGFTHIELMPVAEHPFYGSWGYQCTGFFAPSSRYGSPQDFMYFVDYMHRQGIGVILDWVPSHFPTDGHGLSWFDGTALFEHEDPRQGYHPDWKSSIFNYGRNEVRAFLISNALFWLDTYHVDGLRMDAVASMLYLDYSRKEGEWIPNCYGGRENLDAVSFLQECNKAIYEQYPDTQTIAEESTDWPMVSRPAYVGGLGFGMKWNMGWMHDSLEYFSKDSIHRKYHHNQLTFNLWYAYTENFVLPLSHDEVVYGKGSLINKMPGDSWQKRANLRLLFAYMYGQPGKNMIFMGGEFGQWNEWNHDHSLDWHLLDYPDHQGIQLWLKKLNNFYQNNSAMYAQDFHPSGFSWIDCNDSDQSILSFIRQDGSTIVLIVCNFTPVPRHGYCVGTPVGGNWQEVLNSDSLEFGGSGVTNSGIFEAQKQEVHGRPYSLNITLPPLGATYLIPVA